jgi:hypothetical protein
LNVGGAVNTLGPGGTGTSPSNLYLNGGSGAGGGGAIIGQNNGAQQWIAGSHRTILGGTSDDYAIWMQTAAIIALRVNQTTGAVSLASTTASSSPSTGALVVAGGIGVGGKLYVGGGYDVSGTSVVRGQHRIDGGGYARTELHHSGTLHWTIGLAAAGDLIYYMTPFNGAEKIHMTSGAPSSSTTTGALVVTGGVGVGGTLNAGQIISVGNVNQFGPADGGNVPSILRVWGGSGDNGGGRIDIGHANSNLWHIGTFKSIFGGPGIGLSIYNAGLGEALRVESYDNSLKVLSATGSSSSTTGALIVTGGVGIGGTVNVGGVTSSAGIVRSTGDAAPSSGVGCEMMYTAGFGLVLAFDRATATPRVLRLGGDGGTNTIVIDPTGKTDFVSTTASTSTTSGALVVGGGIGAGGDIWAGGIIEATDGGNATRVSLNAYVGSPKINFYRTSFLQSFLIDNGGSINVCSDSTGNVGMYIAHGASAWTAMSDARISYKRTAREITDRLPPLDRYHLYENENASGIPEIFAKAQEFDALFPQLVHRGSDDPDYEPTGMSDSQAWGMNYDRMGAVALAYIKELTKRVDALETRH